MVINHQDNWDFLRPALGSKNLPAMPTNQYNSPGPQYINYNLQNKYSPYIAPINVNRPPIFEQLQRAFIRPKQAIPTPPQNVLRPSMLDELKRIYFQEMLRFTMNKATFFTLIFSFMFLGCIFFLMGFLTATGVYNGQKHHASEEKVMRMPSEQAMLQARPAKIVDMGKNLPTSIPKDFRIHRGVKMGPNNRQPSQYVQQQINSRQANYR